MQTNLSVPPAGLMMNDDVHATKRLFVSDRACSEPFRTSEPARSQPSKHSEHQKTAIKETSREREGGEREQRADNHPHTTRQN